MSAHRAAVEARILDFLHTNFLKEEPTNAHTSLFLSGLLDSLSMVTLLSFIEEFYNVRLLGDGITADNFDTVKRIAEVVIQRREDVPAGDRAGFVRKRKKNGLSKALGYLKKKRSLILLLKSPRYGIDHFEHPINYRIMGKHVLLGMFQQFLYGYLDGRHLSFIRRSVRNGDDLSSLRREKSILVFMHQPFMNYLLAAICELGIPLNTLVRRRFCPEVVRHLENHTKYYRHVYKPLVSFRKLQEKLLEGESVLLAADGQLGKHHIEVRFGRGKITTPKGIYDLSRSTGTRIVPLFLALKRCLPFPAFEIRRGENYFIHNAPESEIEKIEEIFAWYYAHMSRQPYMWKRIGEERYAVKPESVI